MAYSTSVGIDVSKKSLDVCVLQGEKREAFSISNSISGISKLTNRLLKHKITSQDQIVIESTGDYHLLCAYQLSKSFNVKVINPLLAKHHMKTTVRKVKTDKVDAYLLAEIGRKQRLDTHTFSKEELEKKKILVLISTLEKHIAALKLAVKNTKKTFKDFGLSLKCVDQVEEELKSLEKVKKSLETQLGELVIKKELVAELASIPGISYESGVKVVAMLEDRQFRNKGSLVAFSGLDVSVKQSGTWSGKTKITKRGNSDLRKYLIRIAWGLMQHNDKFKGHIEKYKESGRKYKELLVIIARKFLRMLYGVMKNNSKFDLNMI